jgi:lysophospholipase L1-like esterase
LPYALGPHIPDFCNIEENTLMKDLLIYVFIALLFASCHNREAPMTNPGIPHQQNSNWGDTIRFLALGDSYTIGESVDVDERWPVQLADSLQKAGFQMAEPEIIARTGWTTGELMEAVNSKDPQGPYQLVTLLIGVNNQYRGLDTADYRQEFRELLQMSIALADGDKDKVVVVSIPDYGVTPYAKDKDPGKIAREIDAFNAIKKDESVKAGVKYVDVTPVSRRAEQEPALIADDGLHPSGKMYAEWVKLVFPAAKEIIQQHFDGND